MITQTTTALLQGLVDPADEAVWREFDARYRPIIFAFARRLGTGVEDAADVAQDTLTRFVTEYRAGRYDRSRGRLRSWIIAIAKHRVADLNRARARRREYRGESALVNIPDEDHLEAIWDAECRRAVLQRALDELRTGTRSDGRTIRAFEMVTIEQAPPAQVAAELGISRKDVINAKHRCLQRLRGLREHLQRMYEIEMRG